MIRSRLVFCSLLALTSALPACGSKDGSGVEGKPLVAGLQISEIAVFQALKSTVMKAGAAADSAVPLVAGRPGLLRVYLAPTGAWSPREVLVRVEMTQNGTALPGLEVRQLVSGASTDAELGSTVNFDLPATTITKDLTFSVGVYETSDGAQMPGADAARYPATGESPIGATESGPVKVVLLPVSYGADGSNRMPPTSAEFLQRFHDRMMQLYPATDVEITVGDTFAWSKPILADGTGWDELLNAITTRRYRDGVDPDVYYYGLFTPATSFYSYCDQGCVLGLSSLAADVSDDWARASIGVGYMARDVGSEDTFAHEVGHAHGREHAPCDTYDYDRDFPYSDGGIGVWGYDASNQAIVDPNSDARDMMGYCSPVWISDYNYNALYARIRALNTTMPFRLEVPTRWHSFIVKQDGVVRGEAVTAGRAPKGRDKIITRVHNGRTERITARFYPFDHLPGGQLFLPESEDVGTLRIDGYTVR